MALAPYSIHTLGVLHNDIKFVLVCNECGYTTAEQTPGACTRGLRQVGRALQRVEACPQVVTLPRLIQWVTNFDLQE